MTILFRCSRLQSNRLYKKKLPVIAVFKLVFLREKYYVNKTKNRLHEEAGSRFEIIILQR